MPYIPTGKKGKVKKAKFTDSLEIFYTLLGLLLIVPIFRNIPVWLNVLMNSSILIYLSGLLIINGVVEDTQETVTQKDAMKFPLYGSAVLLGLFIVFKFVAKEYVNALLSLYFLFLGLFALAEAIRPVVSRIRIQSLISKERKEKPFAYNFPIVNKKGTYVLKYCNLDVTCWSISLVFTVAYGITKAYLLNNLMGFAFCIEALTIMNLGSFKIGAILLGGLFVYDIFWVFFTPVMVGVAKNLDAPIKLLFAQDIFADPVKHSMLGLGDIVIPGAFLMLLLRFDQHMAKKGKKTKWYPYFHAGLVGYILGLVLTWIALVVFESAQPALLYLVPTCLGSSLLTASIRGEMEDLLNFNVEVKRKVPVATVQEEGEGENKDKSG